MEIYAKSRPVPEERIYPARRLVYDPNRGSPLSTVFIVPDRGGRRVETRGFAKRAGH